MNAAPPPVILWGDFYVTGGTLRPDAPSYVERQADKDLCAGLLNGEFCYVLTSRQMGKSSLMVRTVKQLREDGVAVAVLDLTAIGQNLTIEQWYDGLISRLGQQLELEDELTDFWEAHTELGPLQRWLTSIEEVVLKHIQSRVVIFVDEIDIVRSLPFSTDEFFAAIREAYNRRSREPIFNRLSFGLLGVATPTDLIRDTRTTPFNIGRRIELNDFTEEEVEPLTRGLGPDEVASRELLSRVLYWTGGHPYLTQRLCRALAETIQPGSRTEPDGSTEIPPVIPTADTVDALAEKLFLSRQARDRDDNLIFVRERILRSEVDVAGLLYLYRRILNRERVPDDETNPLVSVLRLAGAIRGANGVLRVRNRIYAHVFDHNWIHTNMPEAEVRRQRGARRKGVALGLAIAVVLVLGYLIVWPIVTDYRRARTAQRTATQIESAYRPLTSYRDTFDSTVEIAVGGLNVPIRGSGSLVYHRPGRYNLNVRSDFSTPESEVRTSSDGRVTFILAPALRQFKVSEDRPGEPAFAIPPELAEQVGPVLLLPVYRLLVDVSATADFLKDAHDITYNGAAELNGEKVRVLQWQHNAAALLRGLGLTNVLERERVPVTAWVDSADYFILQIRLDLSKWARQLVGDAPDLNVTGLVLTEAHKAIETSIMPPKPTRFHLLPPPGVFPVDKFNVPERRVTTLASLRDQFTRTIPRRFPPETPPNLVDLSDYYNAPLGKPWHPQGYSLEALPAGVLQFGNVHFDVRGIVQLSGKELEKAGGHYPRAIPGIKVQQNCRNLHFLHAAGWRSRDGTLLGNYVVHYVDGREQKIPIVYGEDLRDWSQQSDPSGTLKRATMVWRVLMPRREMPAQNEPYVRLFKTTWVNPYPEVEITTIDYVSTMAEAAPFLLAITAEP